MLVAATMRLRTTRLNRVKLEIVAFMNFLPN